MPLKIFGGSLLLPLRIDGYTFDKLPYDPAVDERFSTQLKDQLPEFVLENYDTFVQFVEAYYEWSEQHGNPRAEGVRLGTYNDIDQTLDDFLEYFRNTYIRDFPYQLADGANEKTLIKNVGHMYKAKGSKASFDLLFRVLFNTTIEVDYPKDRILKLSASTFDDRQFIRIAPLLSVEEALSLENGILVQKSPINKEIYATALIDSVKYIHEGSVDFFSLAVQDISGTFTTTNPVEVVTTGITSASYNIPVLPTLDALKINTGGTGYELGDDVTVSDQYGNALLRASINNVGPRGDIRGFEYKENFGVYRSNESLVFSFETFSGTGASLSGLGEVVLTDGPDSYKDDTGKISGRSFIQDSFFYQNYSYIIRVNKSLQQFADAVRRLVHPSGTLMFAEYINEVSMSGDAGINSDNLSRHTPVIGHYLPHTFGTTIDPRGFTFTTGAGSTFFDFYPVGYNGQDGSTTEEFFQLALSSGTYGTPHMFPENGITHEPNTIRARNHQLPTVDLEVSFDSAEALRTILEGAIGSTGYIGTTSDSNGEHVGLFGFFPVGSSRNNVINANNSRYGTYVKHYGGYTSPAETSLSGGFSGGQVTMVGGTDSATADYWIVHRHPAHLELPTLGPTGERLVVNIPMKQVMEAGENISTITPSTHGYYYNIGRGLTLNSTPYSVGEIVTQSRSNEPVAIGRVIDFVASAQHQGTNEQYYNLGVDTLRVEVLNGQFTKGFLSADFNQDGRVDGQDLVGVLAAYGETGGVADLNQDGLVDGGDLAIQLSQWFQTPKPIIGETSGAARLVDPSFDGTLYTSITYDTSWMDVPISIMVNDIEYSNITN